MPETEPDERRRRPRGERRGSVRLALASRLPWLGCYPVSAGEGVLELRAPATDARHRLDRASLAAATRAIKQLVRDHGVALAELAGDVEAWQRRALAILDAFKPAIHDGAPLPAPWTPALHDPATIRRAAALARSSPALAEVIDALGWCHAGDRAASLAALGWLERRREPIAEILGRPAPPRTLEPRALVLLLRHLAVADGERAIDPVVHALATPGLDEVTTAAGGYPKALEEQIVLAPRKAPVRPAGKPLGPPVRALIAEAAALPALDRRLIWRAIAAARLPELVARWQRVWADLDDVARAMAGPRTPSWDTLVAQRRAMGAIVRALPGDVTTPALLRWLRTPTAGLVDTVAAMPEVGEPGAHAALLVALHNQGWDDARAAALAALLAAVVADAPATRWPLLWTRVLARPGRPPSIAAPDSVAQAKLVGAALAPRLAEADGQTVDELIAIARHHDDVDSVLAYHAVWRARPVARLDALELGVQLSSTPAELAGYLASAGTLAEEDVEELAPLVRACRPHGAPIVRRLLLAGERARLRAGARAIELAGALGVALPPWSIASDRALPDELRRYPAALAPELARLAAAAGDAAVAQAAAILDDTFPDPRALAVELAAIEARLAAGSGDARLARRAGNLRARLADPPAASPVRLDKLRAKLERAADLASFERWRADLRTRSEPRLVERLGQGGGDRPSWLDEPSYQRVYTGLVGLDGAARSLARRLLAARRGAPPWDLRDEPHNRAWLARLRARGVDPAPWLDGIGVRTLGRAPDTLSLSLEDDPLEILRMGEHFGTCLAPTSFNFFAAVVDAAEINKRVVYGRDAHGTVVGRCLLGLTDGGGIVTFHPYCHARIDFARMVGEFTAELARRMGTVVLPTGSVRPLSGCEWYDDGPRDLTGAFGFLADGSDFRAALATIPIEQLHAELAARFAPLPITGLALTLFLPLTELDRRPELIVPLLPLLDDAGDVPRELRARAGRLAERAGRGDLLGDRFVEHLRPTTAWFHADLDLLDLVAPRAPARLLGWLRAVEGDVTSYDLPMWQYGRGLALAALHRPVQAALALRAAARGRHRETRERARARLHALALEHPRAATGPRPRR